MTQTCRCQLCNETLEPAQALRFLVETDNLDDPGYLAHIRRLPAVGGKPLRVCKRCQATVEANPVQFRTAVEAAHGRRLRAGMLTACGLLSVGLILTSLLGGPRA